MTELRRRDWLAAWAAMATSASAIGSPALPAIAPEIALAATDGRPVLAPETTARATWLDFWASWCTPCKLSFPWMNDMHDRYGARGLRIVAVNLDRHEAEAQRFLQRLPARFALAFDAAAGSARAMAVQAMPSSFLIAADRRVLMAHRGFRLEERPRLERALQEALA